ncbi:MAG: hypothetical protein GEU99_16215 [Luteitalea sp.]|nr:hypothetical protein [Luteitalea sp.]
MNPCAEYSPLLSPWLDNELTPEARAHVTRHLSACSACSTELVAIRRGRSLARAVPELQVPPGLSSKILAGASAPPKRQSGLPQWVFARPALGLGAIAALLVLAVALWSGRPDHVPATPDVQQVVTAHPLHLVQLAQGIGSGQEFNAMASTYQLRRIDLESALKQASFKVICPLHQGATEGAHVRELRDCPLIHLSALRGDHDIVLLQQPAGWPIVYGDHPVQRLTLAGEPCDRLQTDERELFKWERGDTRWILVARAGHPEAEKVVSTLLAMS